MPLALFVLIAGLPGQLPSDVEVHVRPLAEASDATQAAFCEAAGWAMQVILLTVQTLSQLPLKALRYQLWLPLPQEGGASGDGADGGGAGGGGEGESGGGEGEGGGGDGLGGGGGGGACGWSKGMPGGSKGDGDSGGGRRGGGEGLGGGGEGGWIDGGGSEGGEAGSAAPQLTATSATAASPL